MGPQRAIHHLLTLFALATAVTAGPACAEDEKWADWGNAPELQSPHPDSKGRSGYWWWPERSESQTKQPGVGNRGKIYGKREESNQSINDTPPATFQPTSVPSKSWPMESTEVRYAWNDILFDVGSTKPKATELEILAGYAVAIKSDVIESLVCAGHTDDTGSSESNEQLGLRRAEAVVEYLKAAGVSPEKLSAKSMGEAHPRTPNDSPVNRAFNRRVSFEIVWGENAR